MAPRSSSSSSTKGGKTHHNVDASNAPTASSSASSRNHKGVQSSGKKIRSSTSTKNKNTSSASMRNTSNDDSASKNYTKCSSSNNTPSVTTKKDSAPMSSANTTLTKGARAGPPRRPASSMQSTSKMKFSVSQDKNHLDEDLDDALEKQEDIVVVAAEERHPQQHFINASTSATIVKQAPPAAKMLSYSDVMSEGHGHLQTGEVQKPIPPALNSLIENHKNRGTSGTGTKKDSKSTRSRARDIVAGLAVILAVGLIVVAAPLVLFQGEDNVDKAGAQAEAARSDQNVVAEQQRTVAAETSTSLRNAEKKDILQPPSTDLLVQQRSSQNVVKPSAESPPVKPGDHDSQVVALPQAVSLQDFSMQQQQELEIVASADEDLQTGGADAAHGSSSKKFSDDSLVPFKSVAKQEVMSTEEQELLIKGDGEQKNGWGTGLTTTGKFAMAAAAGVAMAATGLAVHHAMDEYADEEDEMLNEEDEEGGNVVVSDAELEDMVAGTSDLSENDFKVSAFRKLLSRNYKAKSRYFRKQVSKVTKMMTARTPKPSVNCTSGAPAQPKTSAGPQTSPANPKTGPSPKTSPANPKNSPKSSPANPKTSPKSSPANPKSSPTTSPANPVVAPGATTSTGSDPAMPKKKVQEECWVIIDGKKIDVTEWKSKHPGGPGVYRCGEDITSAFDGWHGIMELDNQIFKTNGDARIVGLVENPNSTNGPQQGSPPGSTSENNNGADTTSAPTGQESLMPSVAKQAHPGSGEEFKTMIYIDLKGGMDASALFVNVKNAEEIAVWCRDRQNVGAKDYCNTDNTLKTGALPALSGTDGYIAMTDFLSPTDSKKQKTSFEKLWKQGKMAIVPGVGRPDHGRSHFKSSDAAAKGVAVVDELQTSHGWLAKAIFAYNRLYCAPGTSPDGTECVKDTNSGATSSPSEEDKDVKEIDAISLQSAAAGPHALETSNGLIDFAHLNHITGVQSIDTMIDPQFAYDYVSKNFNHHQSDMIMQNTNSMMMGRRNLRGATLEGAGPRQLRATFEHKKLLRRRRTLAGVVSVSEESTTSVRDAHDHQVSSSQDENMSLASRTTSACGGPQSSSCKRHLHGEREMTEEEFWAAKDKGARSLQVVDENKGLNLLLEKERIIFASVGVLSEKLANYQQTLNKKCKKFPAIQEWADSDSDGEIGMQLRVIAILLLNGVRPKVFQLRQAGYDTHKALPQRLGSNIDDLRTGIFTFVKAAEACGFWNDVLITTYSEFGRRLADNGSGTDHGWATYSMIFGNKLSKQVFGHNWQTGSSAMQDIVPSYLDTYKPENNAMGDLMLSTAFQTLDACLLDAMGLPPLPRLLYEPSEQLRQMTHGCPDHMRLRAGLNRIPIYEKKLDNALYQTLVQKQHQGGGDVVGNINTDAGNVQAGDYSGAHLTEKLSRAKVLHISRRLGWSPKSLGLEDQFYDRPGASKVTLQDILFGPTVNGNGVQNGALIHYGRGGLLTSTSTQLTDPPERLTCQELNDKLWQMYPETRDENKQVFKARRTRWIEELDKLIYQDFLDVHDNPLRARMTLFFLSHYATPVLQTGNNHFAMCNQYEKIRSLALGNYRKLAQEMFKDYALLKSLDHPTKGNQLRKEQKRCDSGPIENFAREWLERFTVGLGAHGEMDIKRLAKGLLDCESPSPEGDIFTDQWIDMNADIFPMEKQSKKNRKTSKTSSNSSRYLKAFKPEHAKVVVDRSLDYRMDPREPPAAAQYLCSRLYGEFAEVPAVPRGQLHSPEVIACAEHLYDHNYDITYALQHILTDKKYFKGTLGQKKRWPIGILMGATLDFDLEFQDASPTTAAEGAAAFAKQQILGLPAAGDGLRAARINPAKRSGQGKQLETFRRMRSWTVEVGQQMWNPPDVSGWHLTDIWTQNRISFTHKFLEREIYTGKLNRNKPLRVPDDKDADFFVEENDFLTKASFRAKFDHLRLSKHVEENLMKMSSSTISAGSSESDGNKWYSFSTKICGPDFFIQENNMSNTASVVGTGGSGPSNAASTQQAKINIAELFDKTNPLYNTPQKRLRAWKAAAKKAIVNACQFLA